MIVSQGLKTALEQLDTQLPRTSDSITSRSELARHMGIDRHVRRNKDLPAPQACVWSFACKTEVCVFRTMLEIIVRYFTTRDRSDELVDTPQTRPDAPSTCNHIIFVFNERIDVFPRLLERYSLIIIMQKWM